MGALDTIIKWAAENGPFPLGIMVGIMLTMRCMRLYFDSSEKEKDALRNKNKELYGIIEEKDKRIERLHDERDNINLITQ
jgi:hypothetical protein